MVLRVNQVAAIFGDEIIGLPGRQTSDFAGILTALEYTNDPCPGPAWWLNLRIGEGHDARSVRIDLPRFLGQDEYDSSRTAPVYLPLPSDRKIDAQAALFREKFFLIEPVPRNPAMREEAALRIKREVFAQDAEVASLRSYVANIEAAIAYESGPRREPIPDDVKILVWARDGSACTRCGSKADLHFDHIVPVAKGGSNIAENIQLLCKACNLRKSDKIAF